MNTNNCGKCAALALVASMGTVAAEQRNDDRMVFEAVVNVARTINYPEPQYLSTIVVDRPSKEAILDGTVSTRVVDCPGGWECVDAVALIKFFVSNKWKGSPNTWTHDDMRYRLVGEGKDETDRSVFSIVAENTGEDKGMVELPPLYVYDLKKGLIAFRMNYAGPEGKIVPAFYVRVDK